MVRLVFDKFTELRSMYAVFRYFTVNGLRLGFRRLRGEQIGDLEWRAPSAARILAILRHPIYAGAYAYGIKRAGSAIHSTGATEGGKWFVPPDELPVLIQGRLPAYISWEQYLANQEQLQQNRALLEPPGVPRRGEALLAGLVVCGKCGRRMNTRYPGDKKPCYQCNKFYTEGGELTEPCFALRRRLSTISSPARCFARWNRRHCKSAYEQSSVLSLIASAFTVSGGSAPGTRAARSRAGRNGSIS